MWYVRPAKPQISLCIHAVRSEPLLDVLIFYDYLSYDRASFEGSKLSILETPKRVLLQTVKTQLKCSIILHFIRGLHCL